MATCCCRAWLPQHHAPRPAMSAPRGPPPAQSPGAGRLRVATPWPVMTSASSWRSWYLARGARHGRRGAQGGLRGSHVRLRHAYPAGELRNNRAGGSPARPRCHGRPAPHHESPGGSQKTSAAAIGAASVPQPRSRTGQGAAAGRAFAAARAGWRGRCGARLGVWVCSLACSREGRRILHASLPSLGHNNRAKLVACMPMCQPHASPSGGTCGRGRRAKGQRVWVGRRQVGGGEGLFEAV